MTSEHSIAPLSVSANGRYFVDLHGQPCFWLGDTAWPLFSQYSLADAEYYLKKRAEQGFNVVKGVLAWPLGTFYEKPVPQANYLGELPWINNDPATPNAKYYDHVERLLQIATGHGLILSMLPIWGYHVNDIHLFDIDKAQRHGLWLGERFQNYANLIWTVGGDRYPAGYEAIYRAMAEGLRTGSGGKHLMTFHPNGGQSSARFFHNDDWLDFNMIQTWGELFRIYPTVLTDSLRLPVKPVVMDEGAYEDGPEYPLRPITPLWIRRQAWWAWTAGGFYTYGHNSSWRVEQGWINDVGSVGAAQMGVFRQIVTSRDWWRMSPCPCLIAEGAASGKLVNTAMRTDDSRNAMLYFSSQCYVQVNIGEIAAPEAKATWVNPVTGEEVDAGQHKTGSHWFKTPDFWEDAILMLDAT